MTIQISFLDTNRFFDSHWDASQKKHQCRVGLRKTRADAELLLLGHLGPLHGPAFFGDSGRLDLHARVGAELLHVGAVRLRGIDGRRAEVCKYKSFPDDPAVLAHGRQLTVLSREMDRNKYQYSHNNNSETKRPNGLHSSSLISHVGLVL